MAILYLTNYGTKVKFKNGKLKVLLPTGEVIGYPIRQIDAIFVLGQTAFTSVALKRLLKEKIPVHFLEKSGKHLGVLRSLKVTNLPLRIKQYQFYFADNHDLKLKLAKGTIKAKITNSYRIMARWSRSRERPYAELTIGYKNAMRRLSRADDIEVVKGIEGYFARLYFQKWTELISKTWGFRKRVKRPPTDPVNAMLSFGYTLLFQKIYSDIWVRDLDPYFGFLHKIKYNTPTLAADLMEEFRAPVVDSVVMTLLVKHKLHPVEDFEYHKTGRVTMGRHVIKRFISLLEERFSTLYTIESGKRLRLEDIVVKKINSFIDVLNRKSDDLYYFIIR